MRLILTAFLACASVFQAYSQSVIDWLAAGRVASGTYGNLHPRIVLDKYANPMVVWGDEEGHIWFARWGGETFAAPVQLNIPGSKAFTSSWGAADIAAAGDTVYVTYRLLPDETGNIYVTHSYDGGVHFSVPEIALENAMAGARNSVIGCDQHGTPYLAYTRSPKNNNNAICYAAHSDDMGESFKGETIAGVLTGGSACECSPPSVVASGNINVVLYRNNLGGLRNVFAGLSNEAGRRFSFGLQLDSTEFVPASCPASGPDGTIIADTLYAVFASGKADNTLVYLSRISLSNRAVATAPLTGAVEGIYMQNFPRIASAGLAAGIVWTQVSAGNNQLCLSFTDDAGTGFPSKPDTIAAGVMANADIAVGAGYIYIVWEDNEQRSVMFRRGVYTNKKSRYKNAEIVIATPPKGQKYFWLNMEGVLGCTLTDERGNQFEQDISYPAGNTYCKVDVEDLEPGAYAVKVLDSEGRSFEGKIEIR